MSIRTWQSPTSAGDERNLYGQGKPMAKDSSGGGLDWYEGITSDTPDATVLTLESRLDFDGTVAPTDLSRATDAREKGRIGIFGSQLSYAGSSGRVTSEPLGRDLNPLGRGDGGAYVAGAVRLGVIAPRLPGNQAAGGTGNSVNNCGQCGGNPPINPPLPPFDPGQWPPRENPDPYWELNREEMRCVNEWANRCKGYHDEDCACPSQLNWACCPDACTRQEWVDHPYYCQRVKCECLDRGCQAPPAYTGSDADCALGGCCAEPDCDCLSQMVVRPPKDEEYHGNTHKPVDCCTLLNNCLKDANNPPGIDLKDWQNIYNFWAGLGIETISTFWIVVLGAPLWFIYYWILMTVGLLTLTQFERMYKWMWKGCLEARCYEDYCNNDDCKDANKCWSGYVFCTKSMAYRGKYWCSFVEI